MYLSLYRSRVYVESGSVAIAARSHIRKTSRIFALHKSSPGRYCNWGESEIVVLSYAARYLVYIYIHIYKDHFDCVEKPYESADCYKNDNNLFKLAVGYYDPFSFLSLSLSEIFIFLNT